MTVTTLDGKTLQLQTSSPVIHNSTRIVPGHGMPLSQRPGMKGNLMVQFQVQYPKNICKPEDKEQLAKILGQPGTPLVPNPHLI